LIGNGLVKVENYSRTYDYTLIALPLMLNIIAIPQLIRVNRKRALTIIPIQLLLAFYLQNIVSLSDVWLLIILGITQLVLLYLIDRDLFGYVGEAFRIPHREN